jgi:hypothetical protein
MPSWVQHPITGEFVPRHLYVRPNPNQSADIQGDLHDFVSPIDQTLISDRGQLREHNKRHGVTNTQDYGDGWFEKKAKERQELFGANREQDKTERRGVINNAIEQANRRG